MNRYRRAPLSMLASTAPLLVALSARAAAPVTLAWSAPAGCPGGDAVLAEVNTILGGPTSRHANARADVTQIGLERWSVHVTTEVDGSPGERVLEADSCESLAKALVPAETPSSESPSPEPSSEAPAATAPSPPRLVTWVVEASAAGDVGMLPSAGLAAQVGVGVLVGPLRLELAGDDWMAEDATGTSNGSVVGAHLHVLDGSLRACYRAPLQPALELDPCIGAALEYATNTGVQGTSATFQAYTPARTGDWVALHADLLAAWQVAGPLALRASLGLVAEPTRPSFTVDEPQGASLFLHRPSLFGAAATLGVEAHFP